MLLEATVGVPPSAEPNKALTLLAVCLGSFMLIIAVAAMATSIPACVAFAAAILALSLIRPQDFRDR